MLEESMWRAMDFFPSAPEFCRQIWEFCARVDARATASRYGDAEYDWDYRVDTTSATVGWRDRLLGQFHSAYQPTEPALFKEMMAHLKIDFQEFTFIDVGSGKGRVLLMAADYPFRRILGIELLPALNRVAQENLNAYKSIRSGALPWRRCVATRGNLFSRQSRPCFICLTLCRKLALTEVMDNLDRSSEGISASCVCALSQSAA